MTDQTGTCEQLLSLAAMVDEKDKDGLLKIVVSRKAFDGLKEELLGLFVEKGHKSIRLFDGFDVEAIE